MGIVKGKIKGDHPIKEEHISYMLICVHVFSYVVHEYAVHDIKKNGKPDIMGVYRAPNEVVLKTIELLVICIATGFSFMHIIDKFFQDDFVFILVLSQVIDILIMFLMRPYIYYS